MIHSDTRAFEALGRHKFICLTTFRRSGTAVPTPVTYAPLGDKLYVITGGSTGKVKRLRHSSQVTVAPCDPRGTVLGESIPAQGRVLSADEARALRSRLHFGAPKLVMFVFNRLRDLRSGGNVYLEISV